ncbi:unnamed protein product [Eruca vesicaria subsp. sativa]|uniref:Ubiquitin-like protease family profile domain-containing protein n=1 Tax=Eruca vesicaria subsp. sativa TaxID=29727 RepID=A0ABC8M246_ERUVS|nr:unnamed protein product [Eruca vesicaria subsp. sativa]
MVVVASCFHREDVNDDRVKELMELIRTKHDFSDHVWAFEETAEVSLDLDDEAAVNAGAEESDEDFHTPNGSTSVGVSSKKSKKRLPDRGMEKRKHKVLSTEPKQPVLSDDMKAWSELKGSRKDARVELKDSGNDGQPTPTKPSMSQPELRSPADGNFSEADDIFREMGTQGVERLSQPSYVQRFDPSQTSKEDDWWTPMTSVRGSKAKRSKGSTAPPPSQWKKWKGKGSTPQLLDNPLPDSSPQSSLCYLSEESWTGFMEWCMNPIAVKIGPSFFNLAVATRIICSPEWLGNEEMDSIMFIWRVNTSFKRWTPTRVAFMPSIFCLQMDTEFNKGKLPAHGRTDQVWGVDIDRLYFPQFVNGNHWIAVCINIIERKVENFDCNRVRNRQYVEKFAALIPRIVKAVAPPESKKQLLVSPYSIVDVPMKARLNKSYADCGAYALKHLQGHLLGLDLGIVDDEIIQGCRQKIAVDLWEASHDPILAQVMTQYVPSPWDKPGVFDLSEDD